MKRIDLNQFYNWLEEKEGRIVEISLGRSYSKDSIEIWVYDYELGEGQFVRSVSEIDLEKKKIERERSTYEKLKGKYGD